MADPDSSALHVARLHALLDVTRALAAEISLDDLLELIIARSALLLDAERSSVFLADLQRGEIWTRAAHLSEMKEIRLPVDGPGLATHVARTGETINLADAYDDLRFNQNVDQATGWRTKSMLVMPMRNHQQQIIGVFQVMNRRSGRFDADDEEILAALASSAAIAVENASLYAEQKVFLDSFVETMAATIDAKDHQTSGHTERVTAYSVAIAEACGLVPADIEIIRLAAILHDYGKIAIADAILAKPGKLTDDEFRIMREHARYTKLMLSRIRFPHGMTSIPDIAAQHHERMDGRGGPWGLKGEEITFGSRIIAVADVFDALTSRRYYKEALPFEQAVESICQEAGTAFDPVVIAAFNRAAAAIREIYQQHQAQLQSGI